MRGKHLIICRAIRPVWQPEVASFSGMFARGYRKPIRNSPAKTSDV